MLASFTHDAAITHPRLFRLTFGGGRDANLSDHSDPVYPSCIIWSDSYWADILSSEIIVILFTDIARETITCQSTCNTNSRFSRWGFKSQAISRFFTWLNILGFFPGVLEFQVAVGTLCISQCLNRRVFKWDFAQFISFVELTLFSQSGEQFNDEDLKTENARGTTLFEFAECENYYA